MATVHKVVNGDIKRRRQKIVNIGDDTIVTYQLSEHQFETLNDYGDYNKYLACVTFCLGIIIPTAFDLIPWPEIITIKLLVQCLAIAVASGISIVCAIIWRGRKAKYLTTYIQLKQQSEQIQKQGQESSSIFEPFDHISPPDQALR